MKNYPFLEAIGTADDRFLEEVFDDNEHERRRIYMSKKKLTAIIAVAAAITMLLSVSVVAAATFTGLTDGNSAIGSAMTYVVRNAETKEEGDMLAEMIKEQRPDAKIVRQIVCPVIGAHCGPGTIGVIFIADRRPVPLTE